jgi:F0F1-type ATP synthase membrane subunit a
VRLLKPTLILIVAFGGAFLLSSAFPVTLPPIGMAAEPIGHLPLLGTVTNSLVTTWLVMAILLILALAAMRKRALVPSGLQNMMEALVEALWNLGEDVAGNKRVTKFFPIIATIFFFVLVSNWLGLIPGVGPIGIKEELEGHQVLVPILRSPSTDLMTTAALALISVILTQIFGVQAQVHKRQRYLERHRGDGGVQAQGGKGSRHRDDDLHGHCGVHHGVAGIGGRARQDTLV